MGVRNALLYLIVGAYIIICSANLYVATQVNEGNSPKETTSEKTIDFISKEDSSSQDEASEERIQDVSAEDDIVNETSNDLSEDADDNLIGEITPDIITNLNIKLYNQNDPDYIADAEIYFKDIYYYLFKYAPSGMWISAAMAQAYTEGGAGKFGIYTRTNNCFGIMAGYSWDGYVYARSHGVVFKDYSTAKRYGAYGLFRAYESVEDSVRDYITLIQNKRYSSALNAQSSYYYLSILLANGYGENHMIDTWMQIIDKFNLTQYDTELETDGEVGLESKMNISLSLTAHFATECLNRRSRSL